MKAELGMIQAILYSLLLTDMAGALDVVKIANQMDQDRVKSISGMITTAYTAASNAVAQSSDIMAQLTGSALSFEKTKQDAWYQQESLGIRRQEIAADEAYRKQDLALRERQLTAIESRYAADARMEEERVKIEREKLEKQETNQNAVRLLNAQVRQYSAAVTGLTAEAKLYQSGIEDAQKILAKPYLWSKDVVTKNQSIYNELQGKLQGTTQRILELNSGINSLSVTNTDLNNGDIDAATALENLKSLSQTRSDSEPKPASAIEAEATAIGVQPSKISERSRTGVESESFSQLGEGVSVPKLTGSSTFTAKESPGSITAKDRATQVKADLDQAEANKWGPAEAERIADQIIATEGDQASAVVSGFIKQQGNAETRQHWQTQHDNMLRQYARNLFRPAVVGTEIANTFKPNEAEFANQFRKYGGTPTELARIQDQISYKVQEIASLDSTAEKQAKVEEIVNELIPGSVQKATLSLGQNTGAELPAGNEAVTATGNIAFTGEFSLQQTRGRTVKEKFEDEDKKNAEVFNKTYLTSDGKINKDLVNWLVKLPYSAYGINEYKQEKSFFTGISSTLRSRDEIDPLKEQRIQTLIKAGPQAIRHFYVNYMSPARKAKAAAENFNPAVSF